MVQEVARMGTLLATLQSAPSFDPTHLSQLFEYGVQIAYGMKFLESRGVVHGNLRW